MKKGIIIHNQGWGDIFNCIGLVMYNLQLNFDELILIIRIDAYDLCNFIYKNTKLILLPLDKIILDNLSYINIINKEYKDYQKLFYGNYHNFNKNNCGNIIDSFYTFYNIDKNNRFNLLDIKRDLELENKKYIEITNKIGIDYIISHIDNSFEHLFKKKYINNNFPIFNLDNSSTNYFDMIKLIENSKELHLMESSWLILIYLLQKKYNLFSNKKIFIHNYIRQRNFEFMFENNNWNWIN